MIGAPLRPEYEIFKVSLNIFIFWTSASQISTKHVVCNGYLLTNGWNRVFFAKQPVVFGNGLCDSSADFSVSSYRLQSPVKTLVVLKWMQKTSWGLWFLKISCVFIPARSSGCGESLSFILKMEGVNSDLIGTALAHLLESVQKCFPHPPTQRGLWPSVVSWRWARQQ